MGQIRKRASVTKTTELEIAEEAALEGLRKIRAFLAGTSSSVKGARAAQKDIDQYIRLRNQRIAVARTALGAVRKVAKLQARKRTKGGA